MRDKGFHPSSCSTPDQAHDSQRRKSKPLSKSRPLWFDWLMKHCVAAWTGRAVIFCLGGMALLLLDSCATTYRPLNNGAGYSDAVIGPDEFRVGFQGNGETSLERAYDFALLRAAEVTRGHGGRAAAHRGRVDALLASRARPRVRRNILSYCWVTTTAEAGARASVSSSGMPSSGQIEITRSPAMSSSLGRGR